MIKVMLIEDDQTMVSLLTTLLDLEGFNVTAPVNNHNNHYLQAILEERPQVALVDVNLRTSNGLDLVREIRQEPEVNEMKILMSSGSNLEDECIEAGADGFILKPFMPDELVGMIRRITQPVIEKTD
jgi:DNA-binding response OmpR family regulator